jgi:hypothetical protein
MSNLFQPLVESDPLLFSGLRYDTPQIYRGFAAEWPAVRTWGFRQLAARVPDLPLQLVVGNREGGPTQLLPGSLQRWLLDCLEPAAQRSNLKEFDLLRAVPLLCADVVCENLSPQGTRGAVRSWIGPAGAETGLHYDYLDNVAVQIVGWKRWRLVGPGTVERLGAISAKYDSWAVLSCVGARELAERGAVEDFFFAVDLGPGDALRVPAGWWHEVINLTPSILLSGFHGPRTAVLKRWAWVCARNAAHRAGWLARGFCTCHPAVEAGASL